MVWILALVASLGCSGADAQTDEVCDNMCTELVMTCEYAAYPSYESCLNGCGYARKQGADVEHEGVCVKQAGCDEFAIVDCEHKYGVDGTEVGAAE